MEMLVTLIVGILIAALACYGITLLPIPEPSKKVVLVLLILVFIVWLARTFMPVGTLPHGHWPWR